MKRSVVILIFGIVVLFSLFLVIKPSFTGYSVYEVGEKIKLGYCPTMQEKVIFLSEENDYELVRYGSASEVLFALKNNHIDKALIGRKAKSAEISNDIEEEVLESGYTLVSNRKSFVSYSKLSLLNVYSYLEINDLGFSVRGISKEEILEKSREGEIVLISWDDWDDDFELIVVMDGDEKVKDFRGAFLYGDESKSL